MQKEIVKSPNQKAQDTLFLKEIFSLKNDLYYRFFENDYSRWFFDISYKPHQTLSGDSYSVRKVGEDSYFVFLVDAMGKGLTASITSIMSSTFLNYLIDTEKEKDSFYLEYTIKKYINFIQTSIFDDEIVSASFILFDFKNDTMESAIFGMPPILLQNSNGLEKIKSNNLPISKYSSKINITQNDLSDTKKLLIYSDGLNETIIDDSHMYKEYMDDDFCNAVNYKDFLETAQKRVGKFDDDMTFLYIEKERCQECSIGFISIESRQDQLELAMEKVEKILLDNGLTEENEAYMNTAFIEMLLNAYEHGNLQISHQEKSNHMENGTFDDLLKERENQFGHKKIFIEVHVNEKNCVDIYRVDVKDEGNGFDTKIMKNQYSKQGLYSGRGLVMVSKMVDAFYYNHIGNKVILKKFQKKEK